MCVLFPSRAVTGLLLGLSLWLVFGSPAVAGPVEQAVALQDASLVVSDGRRLLIADQPDRLLVPASTMKLVTALAAIERWGLKHRFETRFYLGRDDRLWVKGGGDPYLVSEELDRVVSALKAAAVRSVSGLGLDAELFGTQVIIPGRSSSNNPYDAPVTSLGLNFNTVSLQVLAGRVTSAEVQTPITPTAQRLGRGLGDGKHRINLVDGETALGHFGEVLKAKLQQSGIQVGAPIEAGTVPQSAKLVYTHRSSQTLGQVVKNMLEYSTNFVANDLFLLLGEQSGRASMDSAQQTMERWARQTFAWRDFRIEDGAGLSRGNRLSGRQMLDVLERLRPYLELLPVQDNDPGVRAKTGTLRGVSTYAGFIRRGRDWLPFSLMINQPVAYGFRLEVASALVRSPTLARD
ncbi:MAG: D-alanyl-D-alanine carboxypeptidase [Lamprobacter sp.]|uniref:D-alanyl-D-alanine carboxypeptidase/D-alanyl-D-alanine-endopeptidase n=1 Tax=Lamprobacter sp. TaxID=3100796 RepID=UPI002B262FBB|nr:D-alanyl-D-alanine carboxypeptidase [Lamprobacter sp.]MEA3641000.1 D-alanyl-D-alanine carboxypeptidase [Lamprobacter sp.]